MLNVAAAATISATAAVTQGFSDSFTDGPSARTAAQDSRGNVMLQVAEEEELQVEAGSFCSAFLQEFIMAP